MKTNQYLLVFTLSILATSCQQRCQDEGVVCETYVHRYGVELTPDDWSERGQHGQVISTRNDGVVMSRSYDAGVLHGEATYTFPHREEIQKKEVYDQGEINQEVYYYSSGVPKQQINHEGENRHLVVNWYDSGAPQSKEQYENQLLVWGEYYNPSHQTESKVENYNGNRTVRNEYGQLVSIDDVVEGRMTMSHTFHPNGVPSASTPYVNGLIEGQRKTYTMGGEPATIETWSKGKQQGNTQVFEHGEKIADVPYVNNAIEGVEKRYGSGQVLAQENTWVQGHKHGPSSTYVNGQKTQTNWFFRDKPVNKATFDVMSNQ